MSYNGPLMYRVKPLYESRPNIILPTCMYRMNNIYDSNEATCVVNNLQNKNMDQEELKLAELEKKQLNIIKKLEDLKEKVIKMKDELGVQVENNIESVNCEKFQDIVIKANPQNPPLSVWVLYHMLSQNGSVRLATHLHSSLKCVPETVQQLPTYNSDEKCNISLRIIWRDGLKDHEMMVSPIKQGPIEGEVNIARYISRLTSFNYEKDPILSTLVDDWLEVAHSSIIHGNNKDRQGVLKTMNSHFGKSCFLVGDSLTIADIVMWSVLIQAKLHASLPVNIMKWFKSLSSSNFFTKCNELISL